MPTTYEVIVVFAKPLTLELWKEIEEEFKAIHNQTFKQEVNIRRQRDGTIRGTIKEMRHGFLHHRLIKKTAIETTICLDPDKEDLEQIEIPCHWNRYHMVQTKKDIEAVLKKLSVTAETVAMSY